MPNQFTFDADDKPLGEILFTNHNFRVPRYQRAYSWGLDKIEDFWNDLNYSDELFFFGTFVFNFEYEPEEGYIEIIDGQQRLLTTTIMMACIRDISKDLREYDFAKSVQRNTIAFEHPIRQHHTVRIITGDSIKQFFHKHIQEYDRELFPSTGALNKEEKMIVNAYNYFYEKIYEDIEKKHTLADKKEYLQDLWTRTSKLRVIWIKIASDEDAYTIFETVNARGEELTIADLLKNLIFKNVPRKESGVDIAKSKWKIIEENIQETGMDVSKFIRHFWLSKYNFVQEKRLYKEIKNEVKDFRKFLDDIEESSNLYNKLLVGSQQDWQELGYENDVYRSIEGIRLMGVVQCYVLLLNLLRNKNRFKFNTSKYFKTIEKFSFLYNAVSKQPGNRVERLYSRSAIEIESVLAESESKHLQKNLTRELQNIENQLTRLVPVKELFIEKFLEISYSRSEKSRKLIKYIFSNVNSSVSTGETYLDFDTVNIEHILPVNPNEDWKVTKKEISGYVNLLGNLTLLHKVLNSQAGNKSLKDKIKVLSESEIKITQELVEKLRKSKRWGEKQILERQQFLADQAYDQVWKM